MYVKNSYILTSVLVFSLLFSIFVFPAGELHIVIAKEALIEDVILTGIIVSASGVGAIIGMIVIAFLKTTRYHWTIFFSGFCGVFLSLLLLVLSKNAYFIFFALFVYGFTLSGMNIMQHTLILLKATEDNRGKIISFMGFVGGTVYHATRSHDFWMYLDWLPIIFLCLAVSVYYTIKLEITNRKRIWLIVLILILVFGVRMLPWDDSVQTSVGYVGTALGLLLPVITYFLTTRSANWVYILLAFLSFGFAISFRVLDGFMYVIPMGTHWLWHSFGALSVFFLMSFIYRDRLLVKSLSSEVATSE